MQVIKITETESDRTVSVVDRGILEVKTGIANTEAGNNELQRRIDECVSVLRFLFHALIVDL